MSGGDRVLRIGHRIRVPAAGRIALAVIISLALPSSGRALADPLELWLVGAKPNFCSMPARPWRLMGLLR